MSDYLLDELSEKLSKEMANLEDRQFIEKFGLSFDEWLDIKSILDKEKISDKVDFFDLGSFGLTAEGHFILGEAKIKGKIKIKHYKKYTLKLLKNGEITLQRKI